MACLNTSNIELGCAASVGGVKELYVAAGTVSGQSYNSDGVLTGVSITDAYYTFELQKQTSNLTETFQVSLENGTTFFEQALTAVMNKMDQDKRNQLKLLAQNRNITIFVKDNNDVIWYLGRDFDGGFVSAGTGESGTAFGDRNGYSVTITTYSKEPMTTLSSSNIADVVTIV